MKGAFTAGKRLISTLQTSPYAQTHTTDGVVNFGLGQPSPSLLPLELFRKASSHCFQHDHDNAVLQYGAAKGFVGFRDELANFLSGVHRMTIRREELMITAGNSQALSTLAMVLGRVKERPIFVEEPTYFLAYDIFREQGFNLKSVEMDAGGIQVEDKYEVELPKNNTHCVRYVKVNSLASRLHRGDIPSFIYTIPFYQNPTGRVLSAERCRELVVLADEFDFFIVSDEPYNLLSFKGAAPKPLASFDTSSSGRVITLGSFSKILAPGLRLGYAYAGSKTIIEKVSQSGVFKSGGGQNPLSATIVHSAMEHGLLMPHIQQLNSTLNERKQVMCAMLRALCPRCTFDEPEGGYFIWVCLPPGVDSEELLAHAVAHHGVSFTSGSCCSLHADLRSFCRLSFAFYSKDDIKLGVERFTEALNEFMRHKGLV